MKKTTFVIVLIVIAVLIAIWGCHDRINITSSLTDAMGGGKNDGASITESIILAGRSEWTYSRFLNYATSGSTDPAIQNPNGYYKFVVTQNYEPGRYYFNDTPTDTDFHPPQDSSQGQWNSNNYSAKYYLRMLTQKAFYRNTSNRTYLIYIQPDVEIQYLKTEYPKTNPHCDSLDVDKFPYLQGYSQAHYLKGYITLGNNVKLISTRSSNPSEPGATLRFPENYDDIENQANEDKIPIVCAFGSNIEISGIRFIGKQDCFENHPNSDTETNDSKEPSAIRAKSGYSKILNHLNINDCYFEKWARSAIMVTEPNNNTVNIEIKGNYFENNIGTGDGYAISLSNGIDAEVSENVCKYSRHFIAGDTGNNSAPKINYRAYDNIINNSGYHLTTYYKANDLHFTPRTAFDVHGEYHYTSNPDPSVSVNPSVYAGGTIEIYNNTVIAEASAIQEYKAAVGIRGLPEDICKIYHNQFINMSNADYPIRQMYGTQGGKGNYYVWNWQVNKDIIDTNSVFDAVFGNMQVFFNSFDGQNTDPALYILFNPENGNDSWEFLQPVFYFTDNNISINSLNDLHVADFNNDGRTDILNKSNNYDSRWGGAEFVVHKETSGRGYLEGFTSNATRGDYSDIFYPVTYDHTESFSNTVVGDINGDGVNDLGYKDGSWIKFAINTPVERIGPNFPQTDTPNFHGYSSLASTSVPMENLVFGYFDGDNKIDLMYCTPTANDFYFISSVTGNGRWYTKGSNAAYDFSSANCVAADLNGDTKDEIIVFQNNKIHVISMSIGSNGLINNVAVNYEIINFPYTADQVKIYDIDHDGKEDIIFASWVKAELNGSYGNYSWGGASQLRMNSFTIENIAFGDFDGNGQTDYLIYSPTGSKVGL